MIFILGLLIFTAPVIAQDLHAVVYLTDKPDVAAALTDPTLILTQRAIERKRRHGVAIDARDVPINQVYVNAIKNMPGIDYRTQSKWFNAVHVVGDYTAIENLKTLTYIDRIDYADFTKSAQTIRQESFNEDVLLPAVYGNSQNQNEMIRLDALHNRGKTGNGIHIAVLDSGFPNVDLNRAFATARLEGRILGGYDFVDGDESIYGDNFHGARVLSIMAGQVSDGGVQYLGSAPDASYYLFRTEDAASETPVEMSYWVAAAERADSLGVDVLNVSLGYLGFDNSNESLTYSDMNGSSFISQGATTATEKGLLVVTSAGNSGQSIVHPWIAAPADAPGVFAIGAVTSNGSKSGFSSIGPTRDGRVRPSVVAQGTATQLVEESGNLRSGNGTSYSSPVIAGAMACLLQAFPDIPPAQLIIAVQQSASQGNSPDDQLGFGIPDFGKVFQTLSGEQPTNKKLVYFVKDNLLYINAAQGESALTFQLFNLQGQLLIDQKILPVDSIDLAIFPNGIYIFRVEGFEGGYKVVF